MTLMSTAFYRVLSAIVLNAMKVDMEVMVMDMRLCVVGVVKWLVIASNLVRHKNFKNQLNGYFHYS